MKKLLALGIIFLFIGVSVAPSINSSVVKTSDDLVEVTTQACGIQGFGNTTVKLTKQQYQDLERYLVDFRARLNQTTTREEAVPIFKDTVVELNKYGLLPKGMSVEQAQKLILKKYPILSELGPRFRSLGFNLGCLVTGIVYPVQVYGPFELLLILMGLGLFLYFINQVNPILIGSTLTFGSYVTGDHYNYNTPSKGWVKTVGLLGIQQWNGSLYGQIAKVDRPFVGPPDWSAEDFIGAIGFCGIKIGVDFFLGSALEVSLDNNME